MKWVGVGLMIASAFVGVIWYHNTQVLIGSVVFFAIGLIIFAGVKSKGEEPNK